MLKAFARKSVMLSTVAAAVCTAFILPASGQANPSQFKPIQPGPRGPFQPQHTPMLQPACRPDPAITSVTLTKGSHPLDVQISYTIANLAPTLWHSGPNQQNVTLTAHNANTNHSFTDTRLLPADAPGHAVMLTFTTPMINNAFDNFEFGGFLDVRIGYDPDILLDSNLCNDDANSANNHLRLENGAILGFMKGPMRTQTYRP